MMSTGGMGVIYEAVHPVLGNRVVIKTVLPNLAGNEALADRFRNEALAASRIRDDRLPQVFDIDRLDDNTQYMVMEYLDGEDLQHRLAQGPLGVAYSVRVIFEVLEVLHKVHQIGIIHRDITPRNIFLARSDVLGEIPKLLDFGVAHFVDNPSTRPGEVVGSPFYMAPEQVHGRSQLGPWTDVFAAGVVLYEMLSGSGVRPWSTTNLVTYLTALAMRQPPRDLTEAMPQLPRGLTEAVMRALKFDSKERFPDAAAFAQTIEPFAAARAMLYDTRARTAARPEPTGYTKPMTAIETDATIAVGSTKKPPEETKATPAAKLLKGIQSQLAGMVRKPEAATARRARLRQGERRHMTVLLLSLQLEEPREATLDAEDADQLQEQVVSLIERQLEAFGGHVMPPLGGSLMATFGYEHANEDDAERAVSAALALLEQRHEINSTLNEIGYVVNLRAGVHSGFVTRGRSLGRDEMVSGLTINAAKLLERNAPLNATLVSRESLDLVGGRFSERPFGRLVLKGRAEPLEAFEILGAAEPEAQRWSRSSAAEKRRFVGREPQLEALDEVYRQACAAALYPARASSPTSSRASRLDDDDDDDDESGGTNPVSGAFGAVRLCLVSGGAGIGKSRLLHEFLARIEADPERRTFVARAQPASAAPYSAWVALLQRLFAIPGGTRFDATQITDQLAALAEPLDEHRRAELLSQAPVVAFLLGLVSQDPAKHINPAELQSRIQQTLALTLEAIGKRRAPQSGAGARPAIVVLDNVHRADATSLDMLGKVLGGLRVAVPPIVIVAVREVDLAKLPESIVCTRVKLGPLQSGEVRAIAAGIAEDGLSTEVEQLVVARAAGNPLFVEELVLALREQGITTADAAALRNFAPPTSLFGLILSRVDRIDADLRSALRYASVLGVEFSAALFEAVVGQLDDELVSRKQLVELERRGLLARRIEQREEIFTWSQVLVRDAVYSTVLRENKVVLHELAAAAIERLYADRLAAYVPSLLVHFSQTEQVDRALHYARLAGRRALALGALADTIEAFMMAATLQRRVETSDPLPAATTLFDLGTALFWAGRIQEAADRAQESLDLLASDDRSDALLIRARCTTLRAEIDYHHARWGESLTQLEAAEELFQRAGRPYEAAQMMCTRGFQLRSQGRVREGLAIARKGWETLKESSDLATVARAGHDLGNILRDAGEHAAALEVLDRAIEVGDQLAREGNTPSAMWGRFSARSGRAMTYAAMGQLDKAIEHQGAVYDLAVQEGTTVVQAVTSYHLAHHLVDKGDLDAAESTVTRALKLCRELGLPARELKCRVLLADLARRRGQCKQEVDHLEAAEALARQSQVGDAAWLDVAELLLKALASIVSNSASSGAAERAEELLWEAQARADRSPNTTFRVRVAAMHSRALQGDASPLSQTLPH